jgi:hypothetical protein
MRSFTSAEPGWKRQEASTISGVTRGETRVVESGIWARASKACWITIAASFFLGVGKNFEQRGQCGSGLGSANQTNKLIDY